MILDDFNILFLLNKNINIFVLLDDSLRSFIIFKIIKKFFKKKCFFENFNDVKNYEYNNNILIFLNISNEIFNKKFIDNLLYENNIIIFILQKFNNEVFMKKINNYFNNKCLIVKFNELNS